MFLKHFKHLVWKISERLLNDVLKCLLFFFNVIKNRPKMISKTLPVNILKYFRNQYHYNLVFFEM